MYDGYGNLVKKIKPDGSRTIYIGNVYEVDKTSGGAVTRTVTYYPAGGAMRIDGTVYYVLKDRLGSAYATTDALGNVVGEMRYYAFGETRLSTGNMFTDRLYTGQRQIAELGVYHYNARFYSPTLGRFLSADTLMSGFANPQNLNRFSYVANNPVRYTDPTGRCWIELSSHMVWFSDSDPKCGGSYTPTNDGGGGSGSDDGEPNIPDPVYNTECQDTLLLTCVHPDDDVYTQVAHTVFGEGGAGSPQAAANIMQIMLNRVYVDWTCWESAGCQNHTEINGVSQIPWQDITQDQFKDMSLFVLSERYGNQAAFNAWNSPEPHYSTGTPLWLDVNNAVVNLLDSPVTLPWESNILVGNVSPVPEIRLNVNVQYFVSFDAPHEKPAGTVWTDVLPGGRLQFYGTQPMND